MENIKNKSKVLYKFEVKEPVESIEEIKEIDESTGEEIVRKKKNIVDKNIEFCLFKPTRKQEDEAELYYSIKLSEMLKKGIITKQMLFKQYQDTGGIFSEEVFAERGSLEKEAHALREEYLKITSSEKTDENTIKEIQKTLKEFVRITERINEIDKEHENLFSHCADNFAENYKFKYYVLTCTYFKKDGEEYRPFFYEKKKGESAPHLNELIEKSYGLEESEDFLYFKIKEIINIVFGYYFYRYADNEEDMSKFIEDWKKNKEAGEKMVEMVSKEEEKQEDNEKVEDVEKKESVEEKPIRKKRNKVVKL